MIAPFLTTLDPSDVEQSILNIQMEYALHVGKAYPIIPRPSRVEMGVAAYGAWTRWVKGRPALKDLNVVLSEALPYNVVAVHTDDLPAFIPVAVSAFDIARLYRSK